MKRICESSLQGDVKKKKKVIGIPFAFLKSAGNHNKF